MNWNRRKRKSSRPVKTIKELKAHFRQKILQRYGISATKEILSEIIYTIRSGQAEKLLEESLTRAHYLVKINGIEIIVVYNNKLRYPVTVLPYGAIDGYKRG